MAFGFESRHFDLTVYYYPLIHQMTINVSIVEDNVDLSEALRRIFSETPGFQWLSTHLSAEDAVTSLPVDTVDVVLMDLGLPGASGIQCVRQLKERRSALEILILTVHEDADRIFHCLEAGASGYLLKKTPATEIVEAVRELVDGGSPMTPGIARKVVQAFNRPNPGANGLESLSIAERKVVERLLEGDRYKSIAEELKISAHTVRNHIHRIYQKLHVRSRQEAVTRLRGRQRWFRTQGK